MVIIVIVFSLLPVSLFKGLEINNLRRANRTGGKSCGGQELGFHLCMYVWMDVLENETIP